MDDLLFNNSTDRYIFTGSRLRAAPETTLRLSTSANEAYIDLSTNSIVDISAAAVKINTSAFSITGGGSFNVEGGLTLETGIQIGSGRYGGKIYKSENLYELVIDPFSLDPSNNISDASGQVTIMGDLVVRGNTTTIHSTNVDISDVLLTIAAGGATGDVDGAGIKLGNDGYASMLWNSSAQSWSFNKGIEVSGNILPSGLIGQAPVSSNTFNITTSTQDLLGDISGWTDASGYVVSRAVLSRFSTIKIECSVYYCASPEAHQTLGFRVLKSIDGGVNYLETPVFTHNVIGSNMGATFNGIYNGSFYDNINGVNLTNGLIYYKLQFNRNCPTNNTISIPFGIKGSTGNYIAIQELYQK